MSTKTKFKRSKQGSDKFVKREQPRKDSKSKRINLDNERTSKFDKDVERMLSREDSNDIRWYSKNPQRVQSAARIPFSSISGVSVAALRNPTKRVSTPGVMVLEYAPNFVPNQQVVEQAYQNMYSDIVHANSRNSSYDYTDLAIMHMAGTELFSAIAVGIRAYGLMKGFTEENAYTPKALVKGCGFNYNDLRVNYSHMWDDLLALIAQSRQIWLPNTMPIIERRIWMNLNIYKDDNSPKGQYYMYRPTGFYEYVGFTDTKGGFLSKIPFSIKEMTWSNYIGAVQRMIDALIPDQDRGIMYGDILKAYGVEKIFAMNEIGLDYKTIPTYNPEVLWQIENLTLSYCSPVMVQQDSLHLIQTWGSTNGTGTSESGATAWSPGKSAGLMPYNPMMNFHQQENPTPEQIMIATRMTCCDTAQVDVFDTYTESTHKWSKTAAGDITFRPLTSGTETCVGIKIYTNNIDVSTGAMGIDEDSLMYKFGTNASGTDVSFKHWEVYNWAAFDWAPAIYAFSSTANLPYSSGIKTDIDTPIMEYSNWARISKSELERIHNAAIYSLFNVPTLS